VSYGKGVWSVLYSKAEKAGDDNLVPAPAVAASSDEPDPRELREQAVTEINDKDPLKAMHQLLNSQWKDGRAVHQVVHGDGVWAVVTYKPRVALTQELTKSETFPESDISSRWERGFYIRSFAFGDNTFAILFEQGDVPQSLFMDKNFPESEIEELWGDCKSFPTRDCVV
jgi:hypothetical protein